MRMLRRLPKILRGSSLARRRTLRAWFLSMQYWLGGSDDNIEEMIRFLVTRYGQETGFKAREAKAPYRLPRRRLYHPPREGPHRHRCRRPARAEGPGGDPSAS